jgi:hypothetical protein
VLYISGASIVMAVIISGGVTLIVMAIAIIRGRRCEENAPEDEEPRGCQGISRQKTKNRVAVRG